MLFQNFVVRIKSARIMENATQIISQCAAGLAKKTISGCYTVEYVRADFPKEKAHRCSV